MMIHKADCFQQAKDAHLTDVFQPDLLELFVDDGADSRWMHTLSAHSTTLRQ